MLARSASDVSDKAPKKNRYFLFLRKSKTAGLNKGIKYPENFRPECYLFLITFGFNASGIAYRI